MFILKAAILEFDWIKTSLCKIRNWLIGGWLVIVIGTALCLVVQKYSRYIISWSTDVCPSPWKLSSQLWFLGGGGGEKLVTRRIADRKQLHQFSKQHNFMQRRMKIFSMIWENIFVLVLENILSLWIKSEQIDRSSEWIVWPELR